MSFLLCSACNIQVPHKQNACPNCGHPVSADGRTEPQVNAAFSRASALHRAIILGGWMWVPLILVLAIQYDAIFKDLELKWELAWLYCLFAVFLVLVPFYHLSKFFRRAPRLILDRQGIRGPIVPGGTINWIDIRTIHQSSGQRASIDYATWHIELKDGRLTKVRGLATLNVPYSDLFEVARNMLDSGSFKMPPKRFWSRLWT
jgi:hypothetical protein